MVNELKPFNAIKYTTNYGENCIATKKDGIVTIQGDKNGVRQMPYDEFMKVFIKDQSAKTQNPLERSPQKDSVSFNGKLSEKDLNGDMNIDISNGFLGMGKRKIRGTILGKPVDLKLDTGTFTDNVKLVGTINGKLVDLKLKGSKLSGDISDENKELVPYLRTLMGDKRNYDNMLAMAAII